MASSGPSDGLPPGKVQSIYRYPVKGLSPEPLLRAPLGVGATLPGDRLYAIENGPSGFYPQAPRYRAKINYLMLMKNERLATLRSRYDDASSTLFIDYGGHEAVRGDLQTSDGRRAIEQFFAAFSAADLRGPPRVLHAPGFSFSDVASKVVSIINLASVAALEDIIGAQIDPLRFRANLYVNGWPTWSELDLVGRRIAIGDSARLKIVKRIVRCAATNVDPCTGIRDLSIPDALMQRFGHRDLGVYGEVIAAGDITMHDEVHCC